MKLHACNIAVALVLLAASAPPAMALQPLCNNSPENPTVILALLGAAAAGGQRLRQWRRERRKSKRPTQGEEA